MVCLGFFGVFAFLSISRTSVMLVGHDILARSSVRCDLMSRIDPATRDTGRRGHRTHRRSGRQGGGGWFRAVSAGPAELVTFLRQGDGRSCRRYPVTTLLIPLVWLLAGRPSPCPALADIALGIPFVIDAGDKVFGLFAIRRFGVIPHAIDWFFLSIAFGLAIVPLVGQPWIAFGLVVGFGVVIHILWEVAEFSLMRSGTSGLQLTYETTIQDLVMSLIGASLGALVVATILWPGQGTPATLIDAGRRYCGPPVPRFARLDR